MKMRRGWFGESHRHRLARYGIKTTGMNEQEMKMMSQKMYKKHYKKSYLDTDKDGVPDKYDCDPKNPKKQDDDEITYNEDVMDNELEIVEPKEIELDEDIEVDIEEPSKIEKLKRKLAKKRKERTERLIKEAKGEKIDKDEKKKKLAFNIFTKYDDEEIAQFTDKELENLAIGYDAHHKGGLFGKTDNPFLEELKNRIKSKEKIKLEKAKLETEQKAFRKYKLAEIRKQAKKKAKEESEKKGVISGLFDFGDSKPSKGKKKEKGFLADFFDIGDLK